MLGHESSTRDRNQRRVRAHGHRPHGLCSLLFLFERCGRHRGHVPNDRLVRRWRCLLPRLGCRTTPRWSGLPLVFEKLRGSSDPFPIRLITATHAGPLTTPSREHRLSGGYVWCSLGDTGWTSRGVSRWLRGGVRSPCSHTARNRPNEERCIPTTITRCAFRRFDHKTSGDSSLVPFSGRFQLEQ